MLLSASKLTAALKGTTVLPAGRHCDGRNLYLNVSNTGAMSWVYMWHRNGKRAELGLGSFTGKGKAVRLGLTEARLAADGVRAQLADGVDPLAAKQELKLQTVTFGELMLQRIAIERPEWTVKDGVCENEQQWLSSLRTHAARLLPMQAGRITTDIIVAVLKPVFAKTPETCERLRFRIEKIMDLAIAQRAFIGTNPATYKGNIEVKVGKRPTKAKKGERKQTSHASMHYAQVPAFVAKVLPLKGMASKALAFVILTATRTDEARLARWSEIDMDAREWTIPADRMKAGVQHIVPLSDVVMELLRSLTRVDGEDFLFPGSKENPVIGATALNDKLTDPTGKGGFGLKGVATVHGFRASFRNWVGDKLRGYTTEVFEFCLAHGLPATEASYRTMTALEQRAEVMQAWANYVTGRTAAVVQLRDAA